MNTISKDQSIITQVAAKIAADLTPKSDDVQINIANWLLAFDATSDALLEKHGMTQLDDQQVAEIVQQVFPNSVTVTQTPAPQWATQQAQPQTSGFQVRIKGKQHIMTAERTPVPNLMMTILDRMNVAIMEMGDATGLIAEV